LIESITLEEALKLFELPRKVGEFNGKDITAAIGRFGPYLRYDNKFISLGKVYDPRTIDENTAIDLIVDHEKKEAEKFIANFEKEDIQILNGRFGAYIKHGGENYKIPKGVDAKSLDVEGCLEIISKEQPSGSKGRGKGVKKGKK
jgi:Uncharacterized C-terminal domain of topoisomerase IA